MVEGGLKGGFFAIAFEMVFGHRVERKADNAGKSAHIAAFPLAIPLMAGPGAITAMVLLAGRTGGTTMGFAILIGCMALMLVMAYVVFLTSSYLEKLLGAQGEAVFGRLLGVLLASLAVQYVADGVLTLGKTIS